MSHVIEANHIDQLEPYELCWRLLHQQTREASFFQSLEWLRCYWRHYGDRQKLRALVVQSGGLPIGILPLTVIEERTRVGKVRVLTYPLHDWGTFYGPIGNDVAATLTAALRHLRSTPRDWDMLDLRWTHPQIDRGRTSLAMQLAGFPERQSIWNTTHLVDLESDWSDYWAARSAKLRSNIRRCESRVSRMGELIYERYRPLGAARGDGDPRWDLYEECFGLAQRSWQGSSLSGTTLSHEAVDRFFREAHSLAAHQGMVDVNVLRLDGRMIAFNYNYHRDGILYGVRMGYDSEYSSFSPGSLLLVRSLQDSFARGDKRLDLGTDSARYKVKWATRTCASYRHTYYAPASARSQILRLKHRLWPKLVTRVRSVER